MKRIFCRLLFIFDYFAALFVGGVTVFLVSMIVGKGWNMLLAMLAGMVSGAVVLILGIMIFGPVVSLFCIFPPGMIISMITGMSAGVFISKYGMDSSTLPACALSFAFIIQLAFHLYDHKMRGEIVQ